MKVWATIVLVLCSGLVGDAQVRIRKRPLVSESGITALNLVPTGNGATATWTPNTGTAYAAVDDPVGTPDSDTTYIELAEVSSDHRFTYASPNVPSDATINSVTVTILAKRAGTDNPAFGWTNFALLIVGGTNYYSSTSWAVSSSSYVTRSFTWAVNPKSAVTWTVDDVNGMGSNALTQFGTRAASNGSTGDLARVTQLYLTINYTTVVDPGEVSPLPDTPASPFPADDAVGTAIESPGITWVSTGATTFTVKFGVAPTPVTSYAVGASPAFTPPFVLEYATEYCWLVTASNSAGSTNGPTWCFTTTTAPVPATEHPMLFLTSARRAVWQQMLDDYDANPTSPATWGGRLFKAERGFSNTNFSTYQLGLRDAWLYQVYDHDGDAATAATMCSRAWADITAQFLSLPDVTGNSGLGGNTSREYGLEWVLVYDWTYACLTQPQRNQFLTKLNTMARLMIENANMWRGTDVDQPIGDYMFLAALYYSTKTYNPDIITYWSATKVGGITATGSNYATARNMISYYYTVGSIGGAWYEGSEYGMGSPRLGILGNEALKTTEAGSAFPEIDAWVDDWARYLIQAPTPNLSQMAQNGDDEQPRNFIARLRQSWLPAAYTAVATLADANTDRQHLNRQILNVIAQHSTETLEVVPKAVILYNPYGTAAADLSAVPKGHYSDGYGVVIWNNGRTATDTQVWTHFRVGARQVEHPSAHWGDIQLYRNGEWCLTHPIAYSPAARFGMFSSVTRVEGTTTMPSSGGGNRDPFQYAKIVGQTFGTDYSYVVGTQGGARYTAVGVDGTASYFDPPPVFVHEWTKTVLYLPTADKTADTIIHMERINAVDPESLTKFARYPASGANLEQQIIQGSPRWESYLHPRTNPVITSNVITWTTAGGQLMRDTWLLPTIANLTITEEDETTIGTVFGIAYDAPASEKKYRTKVVPTSNSQWNVLLRVISARAASNPIHTETAIAGTSNSVGVLITRAGNNDVVAMFNGTQSASIAQSFPTAAQLETPLSIARYHAVGSFTFGYTQTTATAKVLIGDLNPALSWAYTLNGGGSVPITEDSSGLEELSISGAGAKTIVVTGI